MTDAQAVEELVSHRYFQPHVTPVQVFNRATDPFLPAVRPEARGLVVVDISGRAAVVSGLETEQPRYYLQHALGFQVHDVRHPHREQRHGRADIGWKDRGQDG